MSTDSTSHRRKVLQGSASNIGRVVLAMSIALVLPPLLVHRLAPAEYGAWVLILQCAAYVNLLELGLQTAVGKFVAQYDAVGDIQNTGRTLSSSVVLLCASAGIGIVVVGVLALKAGVLFHGTPPDLANTLRSGILIVGISTGLALPFTPFIAAFTGLQRYAVPTLISFASKLLSSAALAAVLLMHGKLIQLCWVMAIFNILTAAGQYLGWRESIQARVPFAWQLVSRDSVRQLARYCGVLSLWTVATLFVSGLDTVIVGHYDYPNTGYYGVAVLATNLMPLIISSLFNPLIPAVSSLNASSTPERVGQLLVRVTRACTLLICIISMPLVLGAYPILTLWVGRMYASHAALFLQVLVLGNLVRMLGYPYAIMAVATGKQKYATIAAVTEALVNVVVSIILVQKIGAIGVAIGTLLGAFFSIGLHVAVSMSLTRDTIAVSRWKFVIQGLLRPMTSILPSLLLLPWWKSYRLVPLTPWMTLVWAASTVALVVWVGLTQADRREFLDKLAATRVVHLAFKSEGK
jgi:O-antigen/teichoic acid export membrane protein